MKKTRNELIGISVLFVLVVGACGFNSTPPPISVRKIANDIVSNPTNVGQIKQISDGDAHRRVVVFEEVHDSLIGQVEIAMMLNRLYERYQLRTIGLEGEFVRRNIDASWLVNSFRAGDDVRTREDVIVQMLENGEISSSETMALIYNDMKVAGIEDPQQYNGEKLTSTESDGPFAYLYEIAVQRMTMEQLTRASKLSGQERTDFVMSSDPWVKQEYGLINGGNTVISIGKWLKLLDEIERKASDVQAEVTADDKAGLQAVRSFYQLADKRTYTMETNTLALLSSSSNGLVAMEVGAAHVERLAQLLTRDRVSFVVIAGNSLGNDGGKGRLSSSAYDRKASSPPRSVDGPGMLGSFLDDRGIMKPVPVADNPFFESEVAGDMIAATSALNAAGGQPNPPDVGLLVKLKGVTVDRDSFQTLSPGEVLLSVTLPDQSNTPVVIWTDAQAVGGPVQNVKLEQRFQESHDAVKDLPPTKDPDPKEKAARRKIASHVNAAFGRTKQSVIIKA